MANGYGSSPSSSSTSSSLSTPDNELTLANEEVDGLQASNLSISNLQINTADMPNTAITRDFVVNGEVGATFIMVALQVGTQKYYNFTSGEFEDGHNASSNLIVTLSRKKYYGNIKFPEGSGSYIVKLIPSGKTTIPTSATSKSIEKLSSNATITFTPATNNAVNYATFPTTDSIGSVDDVSNVIFDWDITNWNGSDDAGSFGFKITDLKLIISGYYWYFATTEAVVDNPKGDGEDSTTVTVADVTDLGIGTELYYHKETTVPTNKAGSAVGTTFISAIDTETKTITFSQAVAFEDTETMTFRAYGKKAINKATGMLIDFPTATTLTTTPLTHTVRADVSGTSITLNNTLGISGGTAIKYKGVGVDNLSSNRVISVATPDPNGVAGDGAITVELSQTLTAGTVLTFSGIFKAINLAGSITVKQYPTSNQNIYLDIDKIITIGTQS